MADANAAAGPVRDVPPPVGRRSACRCPAWRCRPSTRRRSRSASPTCVGRGVAQHEPQHGEVFHPGAGDAARGAPGHANPRSEPPKDNAIHRRESMAKAVRYHKQGGPEVLQLDDVQVGEPGQGQVRIRHTAIGVNFVDTYQRSGLYPMQLPAVAGNEGAGVVEAVGSGRQGPEEGRPRRLYRAAGLVLRGAPRAGRPHGEDPQGHQRRAGGVDDAEGDDGALPHPLHLQGEEGRHGAVARGRRRRRPDRRPVAEEARRHRHRHGRLRRRRRSSRRRTATSTSSTTAPRTGSRG